MNRQIGIRDFKYLGKICPYAQVTLYGACAVAPNALLTVAYGGHDLLID